MMCLILVDRNTLYIGVQGSGSGDAARPALSNDEGVGNDDRTNPRRVD